MEPGIILANATGLDNVPATTLKDVIIIIMGLGGFVMVAIQFFRKPANVPQPLQIEKLDKFATRDFCEMKHLEISRRLDGHDADVRALYDEIKRDRQANQVHASERSANIHAKIDAVREELTDKIDTLRGDVTSGFQDVERAIGRIEGKIASDNGE
jgi:t-SNARE complex subunit (syntaxin)